MDNEGEGRVRGKGKGLILIGNYKKKNSKNLSLLHRRIFTRKENERDNPSLFTLAIYGFKEYS